MGYLGFDPYALAGLAGALRNAGEHLRAVRLDDPDAASSRRHVRVAIDLVDRWAHLTADLVTCTVLDAYVPLAPQVALDLRQPVAWSLRQRGLVVTTDPEQLPAGLAARQEGAALGAVLRSLDALATLSDGEIEHLIARLDAWQRDPAAREALWSAVGWQHALTLLDGLAGWVERHEQLVASQRDSAVRSGEPGHWPRPHDLEDLLDRVLASFGGWLAHGRPSRSSDALAALPPAGAARLLPHLTLHGERLADAAGDVLDRWAQGDWLHEAGLTRRSVADRVAAAVTADAAAAHDLVTRTTTDLDVLLFGTNDRASSRELWRAATQPRDLDAVEVQRAGEVVRRLLDHLRSEPLTATTPLSRWALDPSTRLDHAVRPDQRWHEVRGWVGHVVAPWQAYLAGFADTWGWSWTEGLSALAWVASHPAAATALASGLGPALDPLLSALPDGPLDRWQEIHAIGWSVGAIDAVLGAAARDEAARSQVIWSLVGFAAHRAVGTAVGAATAPLPPPVPQLVGLVAGRALGAGLDRLTGDRDLARRIERSGIDRRQAAALAGVTGLFDELVAAGRIPPGTPPPPVLASLEPSDPRSLGALHEWLATAPLPDLVRAELLYMADVMLNPADLGAFAAGQRSTAIGSS